MFKKLILELPAEGFTGETVDHIVTRTNIKNQPELAKQFDWQEGQTIKIVKPAADAPIVGESAATKTKTVSKAKEVKVNENPNEEKGLSKEKGDRKRAQQIADKHAIDVVFENDKGEFFTTENLVRLSVDQDKSKIIVHTF